jgi:N6-adenosine-specific RNA methylase IME4
MRLYGSSVVGVSDAKVGWMNIVVDILFRNLRPCDVASLKGLHHILPFGFIFVWVEKWMIPEVIEVFEAKGFNYVENVCWIHKNVNNKIRESDSTYFRIGHSTLLVLRK